MSEFKRKVGDPLRLAFNETEGKENLFVRAYLYDQAGDPLTPAFQNLTHEADGLYQETATTMPNTARVTARYVVFKDAGFTVPDKKYLEVSDVFDLDTFDPALLVPKPYAVIAKFTATGIKGVLNQPPGVEAELESQNIAGEIKLNQAVCAQIKQNNVIVGVVYDTN